MRANSWRKDGSDGSDSCVHLSFHKGGKKEKCCHQPSEPSDPSNFSNEGIDSCPCVITPRFAIAVGCGVTDRPWPRYRALVGSEEAQ